MSERDRMNPSKQDVAPNRDFRVKWTRLFYVIFIIGIIGAGVQDIPRNIIEFTQIGFSPSWIYILSLLLFLFRIFKYLALPAILYYLLLDLFERALEDGQLCAILRYFISELNK